MGMSADEYWNGDCELVKDYRKAARLQREIEDQRAWNLGGYIYTALLMAAPIYHTFAKPGTKPEPWLEEPNLQRIKNEKAKKRAESHKKSSAQVMFEIWAANFNKQFEEKGGG